MAIELTEAQRRRLRELLHQELRAAAGDALAEGTTPAALVRLLDERRAALDRAAGGDGKAPPGQEQAREGAQDKAGAEDEDGTQR